MYAISGPEVLHAGTSTSLAVTVLTNTGGTVTAELAHGDIRVTQTAVYDGGRRVDHTLIYDHAV